jgi:hypothetical protein
VSEVEPSTSSGRPELVEGRSGPGRLCGGPVASSRTAARANASRRIDPACDVVTGQSGRREGSKWPGGSAPRSSAASSHVDTPTTASVPAIPPISRGRGTPTVGATSTPAFSPRRVQKPGPALRTNTG